MKQTLLEMTQTILSAMNSDEVNSISDTVESNQVALLIKNVYYDVAIDLGLPEHEGLIELNASLDNTKPVIMFVPNNVLRIKNISYDTRGVDGDDVNLPNWKELCFLPLTDFIMYTQSLRSNEANISSMQVPSDGETFEFIHRTDTMPTYYTSFDDRTLLFDAFNSSIDTTLQKSKTLCTGSRYSTFEMRDDFVPDLDPSQFPYFINRAKVRAFAEIKQQPNQEAASEARNQKIRSQKSRDRAPTLSDFQKRPNYGR
jgi:hypothetical protein